MLGTSPNVTIFLWALSAFSVLCRTPVYGWGAKGHQMVAHIAEAHLEKGSARALAKRLDQQFSVVERKAWEAGTPKEWADESLAITTAYVYPLPESREIGEDYATRALPILHKRLVQAGVRLAWL